MAVAAKRLFCRLEVIEGGISMGGKVMAGFLKRLYRDEAGQGLVEYSLVLALIAAVCVFALRQLGLAASGLYEKVTF